MKTWQIAVFVITVLGVATISFSVGMKTGNDNGRTNAKVDFEAYSLKADSASAIEAKNANAQAEILRNEYNKLSEDYNNLRNSLLRYENNVQYQARQPITCTTNQPLTEYSSITTRCY